MSIETQFITYLINVAFYAGILLSVMGVLIIVVPDLVIRAGRRMNIWISTDFIFNKLDSVSRTEGFIYRHHKTFGLFFIAGAVFIFYSFMFGFDVQYTKITVFDSHSANEWLLHSVVLMNIIFSVAILIVGVVVTIRPSLLKHIEQYANHWFTVDQGLKKFDRELNAPENLFISHPRTLGVLVLAGGLYISINLWLMG